MVALTKDIFYGIHTIAILDRDNGFLPYSDGVLEVVGNLNVNISKELVNLSGGSNPYFFASEDGASSAELQMTVRQLNQSAMRAGLAAVVTTVSSSATGTISSLVNTKGTSVVSATTGIASISLLAGSTAEIKSGYWVVKAESSTTVNIYATTNLDFLRGTDVEVQDSTLKLLAANQTITTGGNTDISTLGIRLTGGSGTIGMTSGDVAIFRIDAPHGGIRQYSIGAVGQTNPYVGIMAYGQTQADGTKTQIFMPRVKLGGLPVNFTEKAFGEFEITGVVTRAVNPFNTAEEIVADVRFIKGA